MECLKVSNANMVVYIQPSRTMMIREAINSELSKLLFKFSERFGGVLLAYEIDGPVNDRAKILSGLHPHIGVKFRANLLLFDPKPNTYLEGKVVRVHRDWIRVDVLGFAGAIIQKEEIRGEFKYKIRNGEETFRSRSNKRHEIKVGTMIRFLVKSFDDEVVEVCGSLVPLSTGSIHCLDRSLEEFSSFTERSSKKRKGSRTESGEVCTDGAAAASSAPSNLSKKMKRRKADGVSS